MRLHHRAALAAALTLVLAPAAMAQQMGPDYVTSDNVEYLGSIKDDVGLTTGARIVGDRMFVTSGKNISIYDISKPETPTRVGSLKANVSWENEEVPTNGKILGFGSDFYNGSPEGGCLQALSVLGCTQFFDVRDPADIKELPAIPVANHTVECVLDCQYFFGSAGSIIDARGALEGEAPTLVGDWIAELESQGVSSESCHHMREIRPGVLLTACQPFSVITVNPEDAAGASPEHPKVLYTGEAAKFVHSARWPREGTDEILLTGGEENFTGRCELNNSEFSTYSAKKVLSGESTEFELLHQVEPAGNGVYADGKPVAGALGCSVHWFQEHASFKNGGLVALSQYEDGVRFEQVMPDGRIEERGFFIGLGSSSSSPKWAPSGDVVYSIDYIRGIDVIRWKGEHYVPDAAGKVKRQKRRVRGTRGSAAATRAMARLRRTSQAGLVGQLRAQGWVPGYCKLVAKRGG